MTSIGLQTDGKFNKLSLLSTEYSLHRCQMMARQRIVAI